jgi:hypothetical protein
VTFATEGVGLDYSLEHAPLTPDFVGSVGLYFFTGPGDGRSRMAVHGLKLDNKIIQMIVQIGRTVVGKIVFLGLKTKL